MPVLDLLDADRRILVTCAARTPWGRLVTWVGHAETIDPDDDAWLTAATELHAKRLNAPDGEAQPRALAARVGDHPHRAHRRAARVTRAHAVRLATRRTAHLACHDARATPVHDRPSSASAPLA